MSSVFQLIEEVASRSASDLHLTAHVPPLARIHGHIVPLNDTPLSPEDCRDLVYSGLNAAQQARFEENWELDFLLELPAGGRCRGNAHISRGCVEAAYRIVPDSIPDLMQLGHRPTITRLLDLPSGLVLITGTTGSGKSTTLASMIQMIAARRSGVIITIEDPVEFLFQNQLSIIKQREVGSDTHSFAQALKHVLRQDPDVIVVSEMRDQETIQAGITAAETGHLVLATLHTMDAPKTIDRLVDIFPHQQQNQVTTQLANCLQAVLSQRLIPRADGEGRVVATELLLNNLAVASCIRDRKAHQLHGCMEMGRNEGMHTIDGHLVELLEQEMITPEVALANALDESSISDYLP